MLKKETKTSNPKLFKHSRLLNDLNVKRNVKAMMAGGCFKNLAKDEKVKDVDVFFHSGDDFDSACFYMDNDPYYVKEYFNGDLTAYKDTRDGVIYEFIRSHFYTDINHLLSSFDFTITKAGIAYTKENSNEELTLFAHEDFYKHLMLNKLVIDDKIEYPISSFHRAFRYRDYGYKLCPESQIKLLNAIRESTGEFTSQNLYIGID